MPSPFPGMNPYLEQEDVWHDFHERFIPAAAEVIGQQVRPAYIVKLDEHVYVHDIPQERRQLLGRADVSIARPGFGAAESVATIEAPAYGHIASVADVERLSYIEIRDRRDRSVVTVIELLSPSNKRNGPDREQYLAKRRQFFSSSVHVVEIDLLRGQPRLPIEDLSPCDYYVMVSRSEDRPRVGLWPLTLRQPLPEIPIPLRAPDTDARLDLQRLLHRIYDAAGYVDYIYESEPQPRLSDADAVWAESYRSS